MDKRKEAKKKIKRKVKSCPIVLFYSMGRDLGQDYD